MDTPQDAPAFADRWVLISGASSGIGQAAAEQLARQGARLVLVGRDPARLSETLARLPAGSVADALALDLTQLDHIVPALQDVARRLGRLYGVVHAAGALQMMPLASTKPERVQALMNLNFGAGLELARGLIRRDVLAEGGGSMVWVSSVAAHTGQPGQIAYCASKGAIKAALRALALEGAPRGLRVNAVSPGAVDTPMSRQTAHTIGADAWQRVVDMHPLGTGQPEDVARAVTFLLDPRNRWITGTDLVIDGGYTLH